MAATTDLIDDIRHMIEERRLLKHQSYLAWQRGEPLRLVATFRDATVNRSFAGACAALYACESQVPEVAKTRIAGPTGLHGIGAPRTLQFLEVRIGADQIHAQAGASIVRRDTGDASRDAVAATARECADALWSFLDGVQRRYVAAA